MKKCLIALLLSATHAFAWGPTGHRAVGEIAQKRLDLNAQTKIFKLLGGKSLAQVSTWPDDIKSDPEQFGYTFSWHYTTWPAEVHTHSGETETLESGLLLKSIGEQTAVLKDPKATDEKKIFAIKFLTHLIGDLHMPLHVGGGTDLGGNDCKVSYMGVNTNLHAVWDEGMINFTHLSFTELAKFAIAGRSDNDRAVAKSGSLVDWALESKTIVASLYPGEASAYCKKDAPVQDPPKLSYDYAYKFMPVVEKRLFFAGARLALVLNDALK